MEQPLINFENFTFQYRAQSAPTLHNINLQINSGEKVLIVGGSGSGKSTVANCINGIIPFCFKGDIKGKLTVDSKETQKLSIFKLSKITGTVLQDPDGQFIGLTVAEDVAFALENDCVLLDDMKDMVDKAMALANVDEFQTSAPYSLSGGQKQRVSLAGILVDDVKILLFDEPLANLDPATGMTAIELIDDIRKEKNSTVVIIEHRLEEVLWRDVDKIILMNAGNIVANMPTRELLKTNLLEQHGIREPLYVSALKYASVEIRDDMGIENINTLTLTEAEKEKIQKWFHGNISVDKKVYDNVILEVKDIAFGYNEGVLNLSGVNFSIKEGEMISIVGRNGAGKNYID